MFAPSSLEEALQLLGELLADRGHAYDVVVVGGGGLQLLGIIERPTRDVDLLGLLDAAGRMSSDRVLPRPLVEAVADVAAILQLAPDWLNGGPAPLVKLGIPDGFTSRLQRRVYGSLGVLLASRYDQIHLKLYAAADGAPNGKHHVDLKRLAPTADELIAAATWARTQDPSDGFALMVAGVLQSFGVMEPI